MATYAIGDIHGCYNALETLLENIGSSSEDTFVFLGDYVNRGPKTKQVIDLLIDFAKKTNTYFLRGNHEVMMMVARGSEIGLNEWVDAGGDVTLKSYNTIPKDNWESSISSEHWAFLDNTLPYVQLEKYIFVHAGLKPGRSLEDQNKYNLFWKKYEEPDRYSEDEIVICGHTSRKNGEIANFGHTVCIDTYAYGGKWLSCLEVESGKYIKTNEDREVLNGSL
jgi:serine/threonine protein phosphatase 1